MRFERGAILMFGLEFGLELLYQKLKAHDFVFELLQFST